MIYPIVAYGDRVLRKRAKNLVPGTDVQALVAAMFATMEQAKGVGLAAPQIGKSLRLFVVDLSPFREATTQSESCSKVYINPSLQLDGKTRSQYQAEGCLSIPTIRINVPRAHRVVVTYFDTHWRQQKEVLADMLARVVQHEYDHLEGKLHIDYASRSERHLLQGKLADISQGKIAVTYPMRFPRQYTPQASPKGPLERCIAKIT
ncbi:MAG: peptide deformylase [Bacteroidota bacterium]